MNKDAIVSGAIYGLHSGDGVRYIGYTTQDPDQRLKAHRRASKHEKYRKARWIQSVGPENVEMDILEYHTDIPLSDLKELEIYWIAFGRSSGWDLTNHTDGGEGTYGYVPTPELRKHWSETRRGAGNSRFGATLSDETKAKISAANKGNASFTGKKHRPETIVKMSEAKRGKKLSVDHRAKIGAAGVGRKMSAEAVANRLESQKEYRESGANSANSVKAMHIRWHTNRSIIKDGCIHCASAQQEAA